MRLVVMEELEGPTVPINLMPLQQGIYWGASLAGNWSSALQDSFDLLAGQSPSINQFGQSWYITGVANPFPTANVTAIRARGAIPCLDWYPFDSSYQTPNTPQTVNWTNAKITSGIYDTYLNTFFDAVVAWGHPLFIRFASEMNGTWRLFNDTQNGNTAGSFVTMWRHVWNVAQSRGANAFITWVWCPNQWDGVVSYASCDPGPAYRDWVAVDCYNATPTNYQTWQQIFDGRPGDPSPASSMLQLASVDTTSPIFICEHAAVEKSGDTTGLRKRDWIINTYLNDIPLYYPRVAAVSWFNQGVAQGYPFDYYINTTTASQAGYQAAVANPRFVKNRYGNISGKILPPTY